MSDVGPSPRAAWEARVICGVIGLLFAIVMIIALTVRGDPANALHASSLSWAWAMLSGVLAGFGLPAALDTLPWKK
jgi:hypothetical protein